MEPVPVAVLVNDEDRISGVATSRSLRHLLLSAEMGLPLVSVFPYPVNGVFVEA